MKRFFLASALFLVFCGAGFAQSESWTTVISASELEGYWEGVKVLEVPGGEGVPHSTIGLTLSVDYVRDDEQITLAMKFDFKKMLDDWVRMPEIKAAGATKAQLWGIVTDGMTSVLGDSVSFGKDYTMVISVPGLVEDALNENSMSLNQKKKQLRLAFEEPVSLGLGDEGFTEIVLAKKK